MLTMLCAGCVLLAVWLAVPPSRTEPDPRAEPSWSPERPGRAAWARRASGVVVATGVICGGVILDGPRGGVLALAGIIVGATVRRVFRQRAAGRSEQQARSQVARGCSLLASHLQVGLVPAEALAAAATEVPVLGSGAHALELGGDPTRIWQVEARQRGHGGLRDLARAWRISIQTGAPMSATLEQVSAGLVADQSLNAVVAGELSAPRATGKVMAALPVCGVVIGYLLGGDPIDWLLGHPAGWGCLLAGVLLACLGVLWIETLARRAVR